MHCDILPQACLPKTFYNRVSSFVRRPAQTQRIRLMKFVSFVPALLVSSVLGYFSAPAHAGCGSGFCTVNSNWDAQGPAEPGARLGLRYEYIKLDQLYAGSEKTSADKVADHHEIETETLNKNLLATLDYSLNPLWSVSIHLPLSDRAHSHLMSETGESESWNFTALGDVRVINRYRFAQGGESPWGLSAGVKLPTGSIDKTNAAGDAADRMFQPGSGTTDVLLGFFGNWQVLLAEHPSVWFMEAQIQQPINERSHYTPGAQVLLDGGITYGLGTQTNLMLQSNLLIKDRDSGTAAESDDSGGSFLFLSPGFAYAASRALTVYSFVQVPLYQHVNGVQLTADASFAAGIRYRL